MCTFKTPYFSFIIWNTIADVLIAPLVNSVFLKLWSRTISCSVLSVQALHLCSVHAVPWPETLHAVTAASGWMAGKQAPENIGTEGSAKEKDWKTLNYMLKNEWLIYYTTWICLFKLTFFSILSKSPQRCRNTSMGYSVSPQLDFWLPKIFFG